LYITKIRNANPIVAKKHAELANAFKSHIRTGVNIYLLFYVNLTKK